jgi:glycerol-3-phosphate acyltransferase PlsX
MRIAVDAMGGDHAPATTVQGALEAARLSDGQYEIVLVGERGLIEAEIARHFRTHDLPISVVHASQRIEMGESPMAALKKKPDNSISVAMQLHQKGEVDAVVSAGHTGAVMAAALLGLGRIRGVRRPAIGSLIPNGQCVTMLIDVGANVDSKPINLLQFGIMGSVYMRKVLDVGDPHVGLLSIGQEKVKGNELTLEAHDLLEGSPFVSFVGNVEGRDILGGELDVIVCDGFVGNVVLKFAESINGVYSRNLKRKIGRKIFSNIGAFLLKPTFRRLRKIFDYEEYGGAPLLGINGTVIICHGGSTSKAIRNAVKEAVKMVTEDVNAEIHRELVSKEEVPRKIGVEIAAED